MVEINKLRKNLFIRYVFILLFAITNVNAQKITITNGDTLSGVVYSEVFGQDAEGFYLDATKNEKTALLKLSLDKARLIYEIPETISKNLFPNAKNLIVSDVKKYVLNNRILIFKEFRDPSLLIIVLAQFDAITGKEIGVPKIIEQQSTIGYNESASLEKNRGAVRIEISFSPDKKNCF